MSQPLDLRMSARIVRRHKALVGMVAAIGLLAGAAYSVISPPKLTASALVVLPQSSQNAQSTTTNDPNAITQYMATQVVVADNDIVLSAALPHVRPAMSLDALRSNIKVTSVTSYIMSVSAAGKSAGDAEATANAVAQSYINYVGSAGSPFGYVAARILAPASTATGTPLPEELVIAGLIGLLAGAVIGVIIALAVGRRDDRLRERDEIANAIGVPVLASVPVAHPADPAGWNRLLADYRPAPVHAWRLRMTLQQLGVVGKNPGDRPNGFSLTVLTLSADPGALALGPQLASYAAAQGIRTVLVVGLERDTNVTAALRTACAATQDEAPLRSGSLTTVGYPGADLEADLDTELTVVVTVVDGRSRQVPETPGTTAIVLGASAGVLTAEQLARAAVSAAGDDRAVAGILVADPLPGDRTTGRMPYLARTWPRRPNRVAGMATETRR